MHFGFLKNEESLFHNQIQTILTKSPEHIQAVSLHCDSNLVKEMLYTEKHVALCDSVVPFLMSKHSSEE